MSRVRSARSNPCASRRPRAGTTGGDAPATQRADQPRNWLALVQAVTTSMTTLVAIFAVVNTMESLRATQRQLDISAQGQITDRYTRAIEQLGEPGPDKVDVRLGAIFALQRIMSDSPSDQPAIVQLIAAFVRVHADAREDRPPSRLGAQAGKVPTIGRQPLADIQAALTVIGGRTARLDGPQRLNLAFADLTGANLNGGDFSHSDLRGAILSGAHLVRADLRQAAMDQTTLDGSFLQFADLTGARLVDATLAGANLTGATLACAVVNGTDLSASVNLDATQVAEFGSTDTATRLPSGLANPSAPKHDCPS